MVLIINSESSYLVATQAKSQIVGCFQLGTPNSKTINAIILVDFKTVCHVFTSLDACETVGTFFLHK